MDIVVDQRAELGEGPWWDVSSQELLWVDIEGHAIHRYRPEDDSTSTISLPGRVSAVVAKASGGWVLAMEHSFAALAEGSDQVMSLAEVDEGLATRMNDGKCDRHGRFYAGTMAFDEVSPIGALYRLDPDGAVERLVTGVSCSNGLDWSLDGDTMYYIDSTTHRLDVFDFDDVSGRVFERRTLLEFSEAEGAPDGMTVDSEGFLWVALWGGSSLRRYSPDGELERVVELEAEQVTSACFGGVDLTDLYITSARDGLPADRLAGQRHAGALVRIQPGVAGRPQHPFAG
jgi:sugar lactone lactonase YvrE